MDMHSRGAKHLALAGWGGRTLSASREPLMRVIITDTFERSENAAIALAHWAIDPLASEKQGNSSLL